MGRNTETIEGSKSIGNGSKKRRSLRQVCCEARSCPTNWRRCFHEGKQGRRCWRWAFTTCLGKCISIKTEVGKIFLSINTIICLLVIVKVPVLVIVTSTVIVTWGGEKGGNNKSNTTTHSKSSRRKRFSSYMSAKYCKNILTLAVNNLLLCLAFKLFLSIILFLCLKSKIILE